MTSQNKVLVVAVDKYSFTKAKEEKFYAFPSSYNYEVSDHIAFYRKRPISAVTHLGKVSDIEKDGEIDSQYKLLTFGDHMREDAVVVRFKELRELEKYVESDWKGGLQGAKYTTLEKLKNAKKLSEL